MEIGNGEGDWDDPEGALQLDGGGNTECIVAGGIYIARGGTYYRAGIVNGDGAPGAELLGRKAEVVPNGWEYEERNGIEDENSAECNADLVVVGFDDGGYCGYSATAANGGAIGNEGRGVVVYLEFFAQEPAGSQGNTNGAYRKQKTFFTGLHGMFEIHAEAQANDGYLQEHGSGLLVEAEVGMASDDGNGYTHKQGSRRRKTVKDIEQN